MAVVDDYPVGDVGVGAFNFEIVDKTVWTQPAKSSVTARLENLNTRHPRSSKNVCLRRSATRTFSEPCEPPSTSMHTIKVVFAMSSL